MKDYYKILQVASDASPEVIQIHLWEKAEVFYYQKNAYKWIMRTKLSEMLE